MTPTKALQQVAAVHGAGNPEITRTMIRIIALLGLFAFAHASPAQTRLRRPIQVQVNLTGGFLSVAGNLIADETVDDLAVDKWRPGLSVGYHINRYVFVGYSFNPSLDLTLRESWGFGNLLDGDIVLPHKTGTVNAIETRLTPFRFGLYLSAGIVRAGSTDYRMQFRRKGSSMQIGENEYNTDLDVRWSSEVITKMAIGFGYNYVSNSGISANLGVQVPLSFPKNRDVTFSATDPQTVISISDLEAAEMHLEEETFYAPVVLFVSIGYNFRFRQTEKTN